jgi:hypothetical protein
MSMIQLDPYEVLGCSSFLAATAAPQQRDQMIVLGRSQYSSRTHDAHAFVA